MTQINLLNAPHLPAMVNEAAPQQIAEGTHPPIIPHNLTHPNQAQQAGAQQVNAPPLQHLAGQVAPNQDGFWAKVGRWFREGSMPRAGLPEIVSVRMPNGSNVDFRGEALAPMLKALPRLQRADARANLTQVLENRILNGHNLLNSISAGDAHGLPALQDVADLMLFITASAKISGANFSSGAFNVEDPGGHLAEFLYNCPERYQRSSSHMKDAQSSLINERRNTHHGIDFTQGLGGLPNGHGTLLFAGIPAPNNAPARLFLKMETYGCRISTLRDADRDHNASADRPIRASDVPEFLGHAFRYLATRGANNTVGTRRESIPSDVKHAFTDLQRAFTGTPYHQILMQGNPLSSGSGIRTMMENLRNVADSVRNNPAQLQTLQNTTLPFRTALSHLAETNDLGIRIGNEVTRSINELINAMPQAPQTPEQKLASINQYLNI